MAEQRLHVLHVDRAVPVDIAAFRRSAHIPDCHPRHSRCAAGGLCPCIGVNPQQIIRSRLLERKGIRAAAIILDGDIAVHAL